MPDTSLIDLALQFRQAVLQRDAAAMTRLVNAYGAMYQRIQKDVDRLILKIEAADGAMTKGQIQRLAQYKDLIDSVQVEVNQFGGVLKTSMSGEAQALIDQAGNDARMLIATALGGDARVLAAVKMLNPAVTETLLGFLDPKGTLFSYWNEQAGVDVAERISQTIIDAVGMGKNPKVLAGLIQGDLGGNLTSAMRTARTVQLKSYREASRANFVANNDVVTSYQWVTNLDSQTCEACIALNGTIYDTDIEPENHWNCLVPGALVHSPIIEATTSRHYEGDVFTIHISSGQFLTVTPYHPILTRRGWIAAKFIHEGDDVFCYSDADWKAQLTDPDKNHIPTRIENVAGAYGMDSFRSVPTSAEDFHGDGQIGYTKVNVVRTDRLLPDKRDGEDGRESLLVNGRSGHDELTFAGDRSLTHSLDAWRDTFSCVVGRPHPGDAFIDGKLAPLEAFGFGLTPDMDTLQYQPTADHVSGNANGVSNLELGFSTLVAPTYLNGEIINYDLTSLTVDDFISGNFVSEQILPLEFIKYALVCSVPAGSDGLDTIASNVITNSVVKVDLGRFSGHVYNLQTKNGWYSANSIITHNCRCTIVPVTILNPNPTQQSGEDWFNQQDKATQTHIMGAEKLAAYKDGKFQFSDLVNRTEDTVWGHTLTVTPLKDLVTD